MLRSLLLLTILAFTAFRIPPDSTTDKLVMKAALDQLPIYTAKVEPGHEAEYGFTDKDNLENCSVAKPYRILTFNTDFYSGPLVENTIYVEMKNEWRVPVTHNGEHKVLLTVSGNPGNYAVSGMTQPELAKELEYKAANADDNDQYYLLRVYPLNADFFVSEPNNSFSEARFTPLASAHRAMPAIGDNKKSYTLDEVQQFVKKGLAMKGQKPEPAKKKSSKKRTKK